MSIIFKFIFERFTDLLGLPIDPIWEYFILALIGLFVLRISYLLIGDMFSYGVIESRFGGLLFHWILRLILFFATWAIVYFIIDYWQLILIIAFLGIAIFVLVMLIIRKILKT